MTARRIFRGIISRSASIGSALLPFVLILFLCPEPNQEEIDDYLPSVPARAVAIQFVKTAKSFYGEKAGNLQPDLVVGDFPLTTTFYQAYVQIEPYRSLLQFGFLTNRLARSPPHSFI